MNLSFAPFPHRMALYVCLCIIPVVHILQMHAPGRMLHAVSYGLTV